MHTKMPNSIDVHVGSQIRLRRKSLRLSQTTLGERLGITFQQVQKYEKGTNRVGASRLQAIASILGVEVAFFFNSLAGDTLPVPMHGEDEGNTLRSFVSSNEGFALNQAFFKIKDPLTRRRIVALLKSLGESSVETDEKA
ncbi:helix-turn-helix domain-containing protein [Rhizobium terrae]|uniref:helix-turn-helix domain-containing protein n=1 Tax=Rhizobium terrae TaxID=2171756 RepID=UPI000E3E8569|nr:helix-turn-helix transcriptional regulator [Rhizobium terrae]